MRRAARRIVLLMSVTHCGGMVAEQPEAGARDAGFDGVDSSTNTVDASCVGEQCTDPHQCGAVGHDCHGGACVDGACQPVVMATPDHPPFDIAVDATDIYWSTSVVGTIVRCAIDGCNSAPTALPNTSNAAGAIALGGGSLYWIGNDGSVAGCDVATCSPTVFASGQYFPSDVTVDASNLYWADADTINRCSLTGCAADPILASGQQNPTAIAVDGVNVYWTNVGNGVSGIMRCAIGGCGGSPTMLANAKWPLDIVTDGKFVYWTDYDEHTVMKCAVGGGNPSMIAQGNQPYGIAIDDADVYWTDHGNFSVMKCAKSGCSAPITVANNQLSAARIVVDAQNVYWATVNTVMKLAK